MLIQVSQIKDHPDNLYFFDNMEGGKWEDFVDSIRDRGIIEKPILTEDLVIVGGHQRIRACRELGITEIDCEVRCYDTQSAVLRDLIEMNVQQRGEIICGRVKKARIIRQLEEIYGIKNGGDRKSEKISSSIGRSDPPIKRSVIEEELHMSPSEYERTKNLLSLIPSLQNHIEDGLIPFRAASDILTRLSEDEQEQLITSLPVAQKLTAKQIQGYVDKIRGLEQEKEELIHDKEEFETDAVEAQRVLAQSETSQEYIALMDKYKDAQLESRTYYEQVSALKKRAAEQQKASDQALKDVYNELSSLRDQLSDVTAKHEVEIQEAIEEALASQLPYESPEEIESQTRYQFQTTKDPAELGANYASDIQVTSGSFLSRLKGYKLCVPYLHHADIATLRLIIEQFQGIITESQLLLNKLEEKTSCKIA